jgi:hypothetical protein
LPLQLAGNIGIAEDAIQAVAQARDDCRRCRGGRVDSKPGNKIEVLDPLLESASVPQEPPRCAERWIRRSLELVLLDVRHHWVAAMIAAEIFGLIRDLRTAQAQRSIAPALFSATTEQPRPLGRPGAIKRARISVVPPGGYGETSLAKEQG